MQLIFDWDVGVCHVLENLKDRHSVEFIEAFLAGFFDELCQLWDVAPQQSNIHALW